MSKTSGASRRSKGLLETVTLTVLELALYMLAALLFLWAHHNYEQRDIFWAGFEFALGIGVAANVARLRE